MDDTLSYNSGPMDGAAFWFINSLVTVKASTSTTGGLFSMVHQVVPSGFATPYHSHADEDESFYVLEGEVTFFKDGVRAVLKAGEFIFLPRGMAHGFRVDGSLAATLLLVIVPGDNFISFVREMGEPAGEAVLPQPSPPDFPKLKRLSEKHGSIVLGPLPA